MVVERAVVDGAFQTKDDLFNVMSRSWGETEFSKGHIGMLRDFVLLSYPEGTPNTIRFLTTKFCSA